MIDQLEKLKAARDAAAGRERELLAAAREVPAKAQALETELATLLESAPEQFATNGQPKAKTEAAKLHAELTLLRNPVTPWERRLGVASDASRAARNAVDRFVQEHLEELAAELEPEARAAVAAVEQALQAVVDAADRYADVYQRFVSLLTPIHGLDGSDMPPSDQVTEIRRSAARIGEGLRPPLPRSLYPEGSAALKVKTDGGWVRAGQPIPETHDEPVGVGESA